MNHFVAWLWQGAVIAGVTTFVVRIVPPSAASKRHFIWWMALLFTLLLPCVEAINWFEDPQLAVTMTAPIEASGISLTMPPSWLITAAAALWAAVAILYFCRLVFGLQRLRHLVASSSPFDLNRVERFSRWQAARRSGRHVQLRVSNDIAGACAVGLGQPTIVVSSSLAAALGDDALESIVLHEQAHLQRYDDWARALQCLVLAFLRWHPAVFWISRKIDVEREIACDQCVVAQARAPLAYARNLAEAAELIARARGTAPMLAPGSSTASRMLRVRIERLLGPTEIRPRSFASCASVGAGLAVAAMAIGVLNVPQLITFTEQVAHSTTLASNSFFTGIPHLLPQVFTSRTSVDLPTESIAAPVPQTSIGLSERAAVHSPVDDGNLQTAASHPAVVSETAAVNTVSAAPEHLGSTSISFVARVPSVESSASQEADGIDWGAFGRRPAAAGTSVARAGTATGVAASRAGTSVGRFFKNGGLAIARSF
jgi:beta-lactamase regulating signal transducer with metallopeptidase domain